MSSQYPLSVQAVSLRQLLSKAVFVGAEDIKVRRCVGNAQRCQRGDIFVPQAHSRHDGHEHVAEAVKRGAAGIVTERLLPIAIPQCLVEDTRVAYSQISQALVGNPAQRMLSVAVAGTHSKTTTALFLAAMFKRIGGQVAYYTSLGSSDSQTCDRTAILPPSARKLAHWMHRADISGAPAIVTEIAQPMMQNHVAAGVEFDLLVLTGMRPSQHQGAVSLGRYKSMISRYAEQMKSHGMVLYNADDSYAAQWIAQSELTSIGYGLDASQHVRAKRLTKSGGQQQLMVSAGNLLMPLTLNIPGEHNARAALAAIAAAWMFDLPVPEAIAGVEALQSIPGRMQRVQSSVDVPVYIDAGDTPDRIATALHALRVHQFGNCTAVVDLSQRLHAQWRGRLGEVLEKGAHRVVLTATQLSPNSAQGVAMDVLGGFQSPGRVEVIANRSQAIHWAIQNATGGSVLLAGCGAHPWQDVREHKLVTDESIAREAIQAVQRPPLLPALGVFPPPASGAFFSH